MIKATSSGPFNPALAARVIHAALVAGVLLLLATTWIIVRARPAQPPVAAPWLPILAGVSAVAFIAAFLVSRGFPPLGGATPDAWWQRNQVRATVVWALSEGPALLGGVGYLLTGDARCLAASVVGLLLLVRFSPARLIDRA